MIVALVVAGGRSNRFNAALPKQFTELNGVNIIERSVKAFSNSPQIAEVFCVIPQGYEQLYRDSFHQQLAPQFFYGGGTRQESVYKGLQALRTIKPSKVLIHDAARPLVSSRIIDDVIKSLAGYRAVDVGIEIVDTIKSIKGNGAKTKTLNRDELYATQTPQGFDYEFIMKAHEKYKEESFSDDISLAIAEGEPIAFVRGERVNIKITTPEDIKLAKLFMEKNV